MKVIITNRQKEKIIYESARMDRVIDLFLKDVSRITLLWKWIEIFFVDYAFTLETIKNNERLYTIFLNFLKNNNLYHNRFEGHYLNELYKILDYIIERETKNSVSNKTNPLKSLNYILSLKEHLPWEYVRTKGNSVVNEVIDGLLYDIVKFSFENYEPTEAIRRISIIVDKLRNDKRKEIYPIVKDFAEKNGITLIPKHAGYTFRSTDNSMIRDLINYMKDIPEIPKKTRNGFLRYIGSHTEPGQLSTFWSAVNKSGIIQKVRSGNNITYELGPNYKSWEEGKVVAF